MNDLLQPPEWLLRIDSALPSSVPNFLLGGGEFTNAVADCVSVHTSPYCCGPLQSIMPGPTGLPFYCATNCGGLGLMIHLVDSS